MDVLTAAFVRFRDQGDLDALGRVFDATAPKLQSLAMHLTGNAADAEDALQAAFVVAMRKAAHFDSEQALMPWLTGILSGEANNVRRREARRRMATLPPDPAAELPDVDGALDRRQLVAQLRTQVDALPAEQRQVLLLQLEHGLQPAEIAEVLSVAPGTVRMRIHRGLASLRKLLPAGLVAAAAALAGDLGAAMPVAAPRGLQAVRECVQKAAAEQAAAAAAGAGTAMVVGGVVMKKIAVGALAVALAVLVSITIWPLASEQSPKEPRDLDVAVAGAKDARSGSERDGALPRLRDADPGAVRDPVRVAPGGLRCAVRGDRMTQTGPQEHEATSTTGSGMPFAGVLVEAWPSAFDHVPVDGQPRRVRADGDGVARFDGLAPGAWRVVALAGGSRACAPHGVIVPEAGVVDVELHLATIGERRGIVVDASGAVIAGAEVWAGSRLLTLQTPAASLRLAGISDATGRFVVSHTSRETSLCARRAGFAASRSHPLKQLGSAEIVLRLGDEVASVAGTVVGGNQEPLAGVAVAIESTQETLRRDGAGRLLAPTLAAVARTDASGRFAFDGLPPGSYGLQAWLAPHGPAKAEVRVAAGERSELRLVMKPRAVVYGYLRDREGRPQAGVYVMRSAAGGRGSSQTTISNRDGSYRFEGVRLEPFALQAYRMSTKGRAAKQCPAPQAALVRVDLTLDEGPLLTGMAHTESGRALANWHVEARSRERGEVRETTVSSNGSFAIAGLPPGACEVRFSARKDSGKEPLHVAQGTVGVPMTVRVAESCLPSGSLRGRLLGADGWAAADAWVTIRDEVAVPVPADADGRFVLRLLPVGTHWLEAGAPGCVPFGRGIDLRPGDQLELGDIQLVRGATLRLRWRGGGPSLLAHPPLPALLRDGGGWLAAGAIDYAMEGGEVVVTRIPAGSYMIHPPHGDELFSKPVPVSLADGEERRLEVPVAVGRRCVLRFVAEEADETLHVVVRAASGDALLDELVVAGVRAFESTCVLPIGQHVVEAEAPSGTRYRQTITVGDELDARRRMTIARVPR